MLPRTRPGSSPSCATPWPALSRISDADYNERSDQWSVPVGADALLFYAVVREPPTVIVLRLVSFA
jgi:hypothetical protein